MRKLYIALSIVIITLIVTLVTFFIIKNKSTLANFALTDKPPIATDLTDIADITDTDTDNDSDYEMMKSPVDAYLDDNSSYPDVKPISTIDSPESKTVLNFINWAKKEEPQMKFHMVEGGIGSIKPDINYTVNSEECELYLDFLKKSGYLTDAYINEWSANFKRYSEHLKNNPANDGPPDGFDYDFLFLSQEINDDFLADISKASSVRRYLKLNDNESIVLIDEMPIRLTYRVLKVGDRYLINEIINGVYDYTADIPEIKSVLDFVNWAKRGNLQYDYNFVIATDGKPYKVDIEATERYIKSMKDSGYFSDKYINRLREYFHKYAEIYEKEPRDVGKFEGFNFNFIFQSMPATTSYYEFSKTPMTFESVVDYIKIDDNKSQVVLSDGVAILAVTVSKIGGRYLVDEIKDKSIVDEKID